MKCDPTPGPRLRAVRSLIAGLAVLLAPSLWAQTYAEMVADPASWPADVEVKATTRGSLLQGDKVSGIMLVGPGHKLAVLKLRPDGIMVRSGSFTVLLPVEKTTLTVAAAADPAPEEPAADPVAAPGPTAAAPSVSAPVAPSEIQRLLVGRLVELKGDGLRPYDVRRLNGVKFYGIMFSAGWCGPCREFAPHLLESYRSIKSIYPEFELVLVSNDHSASDMLAFMRDENMPWPALKYDDIRQTEGITRLGGPGIPCLVLIDADGNVLADSFKGSDYLGPDSVLDAAWRALRKGRHQG